MSKHGDDDYRGLGWAHGALTVQRLGAMLAPVTFVLADGRQVSPFHIAPWADEPGSDALPGILRKLRGEWPCVPFGYSVPADGWEVAYVDEGLANLDQKRFTVQAYFPNDPQYQTKNAFTTSAGPGRKARGNIPDSVTAIHSAITGMNGTSAASPGHRCVARV